MRAPSRPYAAGVPEKGDNLAKLAYSFIDAGHVVKGHLRVRFEVDLGIAPARHQAAGSAHANAAQQEDPKSEKEQNRYDPGQ